MTRLTLFERSRLVQAALKGEDVTARSVVHRDAGMTRAHQSAAVLLDAGCRRQDAEAVAQALGVVIHAWDADRRLVHGLTRYGFAVEIAVEGGK